MPEKELTKAEAAKLAKRTITKTGKDGKTETQEVPVKDSEVLSFKDYGDHVVVVTVDGKKFTGRK